MAPHQSGAAAEGKRYTAGRLEVLIGKKIVAGAVEVEIAAGESASDHRDAEVPDGVLRHLAETASGKTTEHLCRLTIGLTGLDHRDLGLEMPVRLNEILDSDAGARFIGEFAIGFNPHILEPMRDILFDEKIAGSFHFTPGQAYDEADNGNRSQVHWDMVNIQRKDYGGGEIYFDGKLIRKNGVFLAKALAKLNP